MRPYCKVRRLVLGWSQGYTGRQARIRQQDISLIEQGRLLPSPAQTERLAAALGIEPDDLFKPVRVDDVSATLDVVAR